MHLASCKKRGMTTPLIATEMRPVQQLWGQYLVRLWGWYFGRVGGYVVCIGLSLGTRTLPQTSLDIGISIDSGGLMLLLIRHATLCMFSGFQCRDSSSRFRENALTVN
ncbi:hypothetical protein F4781DRAFT_175521 [Annulohypoxylon bovei var. microspora]|nr:hypothetical protein F4781DRAFT_175521 [Annulohypoxylon bovei var. microspora]